ncbi:MAG: SsrA-binding protein SmpB [bacterium]|nr:SsrA-binding protein SmpB [bacterium]
MHLLDNKKAGFKYELVRTLEAGIELFGFEVKSLRNKQGTLDGAYAIVRGGEVFLVNAYIPPYQPKNTPKDYDSRRNRKLLLTKSEIAELAGIEIRKGLTIVPVSVYSKGRKVKVGLALARGKKKHDKRETLKRRDAERDIMRSLKNQ